MKIENEKLRAFLKYLFEFARNFLIFNGVLFLNKQSVRLLGPEEYQKIAHLDPDLGFFSGTSGLIFAAVCALLPILAKYTLGKVGKSKIPSDRDTQQQ